MVGIIIANPKDLFIISVMNILPALPKDLRKLLVIASIIIPIPDSDRIASIGPESIHSDPNKSFII